MIISGLTKTFTKLDINLNSCNTTKKVYLGAIFSPDHEMALVQLHIRVGQLVDLCLCPTSR